MLDFEAYQQGVREYWRRLDRSKVTNFYEEEAEKMNWNTATRILSIGPGTFELYEQISTLKALGHIT